MLEFHLYKKQYGGVPVIGIPSMQLAAGTYWLKGENGCGKTTLIKSIAGLIPYDGSIRSGKADINTDRVAYTLGVNYAEAEPQYPAFLTGSDLVSFYAKAKKALPGQVSALVAALGIGCYAGSKAGAYSSGMTKKLSLVLAFIGSPKLILLDEPLITLDQQSVAALLSLIGQYRDNGVSFLITSHQDIDMRAHTPQRLLIQDKTLVRA